MGVSAKANQKKGMWDIRFHKSHTVGTFNVLCRILTAREVHGLQTSKRNEQSHTWLISDKQKKNSVDLQSKCSPRGR